ncbi:MFS transporter [Neobacillus paridis]|uniref:MFS transporter n=1 Tax=Neobacillus paridis TaxID=2803862 RepID=UPI0027D258C9|nr:MFS transporter [Neobacillus paridis]
MPYLIFAPIGGRLADRFSRKNILVTTDLVRIVFALSFLMVHGKEDLWIVYVSTFMLAAGEAIYSPTRKSAIPQLVYKENRIIEPNPFCRCCIYPVLRCRMYVGDWQYLF